MAWQPKGNIKGPKGDKGDTGNTGAQGVPGTPGEGWSSGAGAPSAATGTVGDWYINTTNGDFYEKTGAATWTLRGNLKGPQGNTGSTGSQGPAGVDGAPGEKWFTGAGVPAGTLSGSIVGDWYLNSTNGDYYEKTATTTWTLRGNLTGPQGPQGVPGTSVTPAALTRTNDTNVTLTLSGTPATALLQAVALTLGWAGTLAVTRGGSGRSDGEWPGTATNDNAPAGQVGETVASYLPFGSSVSYTSNQAKNLTSISLTAGDWDVRGIVNWNLSSMPSTTHVRGTANIGTVTNTITDDGAQSYVALVTGPSVLTTNFSNVLSPRRISLAATTTVYLVGGSPVFASGTVSAFGFIEARRIR